MDLKEYKENCEQVQVKLLEARRAIERDIEFNAWILGQINAELPFPVTTVFGKTPE